MPTWLLFAVAAQFLYALTTLIDKHIVVKAAHIGRPVVYTFFVSLLSGAVVVLAPFLHVSVPGWSVLLVSLASAATFVAGLFFFYSALRVARASDVAPAVGALSAVATLLLAAYFIADDAPASMVLPVTLLIAGTALISHLHFTRRVSTSVCAAGVFFGTSVFLAKLVYIQIGFLDGFFWTRSLCVVVALALLASASLRRAIFHSGRHSSHRAKALVVGNKAVGSAASILMAYAVSLGSVSAVNALSGLQFAFLFVFALLFAKHMPRLAEQRDARAHGGWHSAVGVALIALGLWLLYTIDGVI